MPQLKDWERMMQVITPGLQRPRRLSIHTIAAVCGRDPLTILDEMQESNKVTGYVCPDVQTPIFYLSALAGLPGMIDSRSLDCWEAARQKLKDFPFPATQGFTRFARDKTKSATPTPFQPGDEEYEKLVRRSVQPIPLVAGE